MQCHCYVCDSLAPCALWGSGISRDDHCHASDKEECWKLARKRSKQLKNPLPSSMPISKPGAGSLLHLPQLQPISTGLNQLMRPTSTCGVPSTFGLPNIIRSQRSSIAVPSNRFHPHLISRQLLRSCNSNTQVHGSRGVSLAPRTDTSRAMFKRSGLTSRAAISNRPTHRTPSDVTVAYLQLPKQQLTENLAANNSTTSTVSSLQLDLNPSFCLPSTSSISPSTSSLQLQQHSPHTPTSHFHGGHSAAIPSNSPYAYTYINPTQNVPGLVVPCYINAQNNITLCTEQSAVTQTISDPNLFSSNPDVQRSHQTSAEDSFSSPMFSCSTSNALDSFSKSCQQPAAENSLVRGGVPMHEFLPTPQQNVQPFDNAGPLEFDFENWLHDSETILGPEEEESFLLDMNDQALVPEPVDAGMLYFDFETSWKGLTHS